MVKIKTKKIIIIAISAIVTIIAGLFLFGFLLKITSDINYLPKGQYLFSSKSPQGSFTIDVFLCDGGATTDYGIRCSVTDQIGQTRNIYWNYAIIDEVGKDVTDYIENFYNRKRLHSYLGYMSRVEFRLKNCAE